VKGVAQQLDAAGVAYVYEPEDGKIEFDPPPVKKRTYLPDFVLENGVIIEVKGRFDSKDRTKHLLIKAQHPELDIRFLFQYDNTLVRNGKLRYSDWCDKHGFLYALGEVPEDWYASD